MAKVKIQGNASGTGVLTVTAPNTSTDRTITLPDSTGTLATTADVPAGISSSADATAITIGSDESVGIDNSTGFGTYSGTGVKYSKGDGTFFVGRDGGQPLWLNRETSQGDLIGLAAAGSTYARIGTDSNDLVVKTGTGGNTEQLRITDDGRGLSQFTARGWVHFSGVGTLSIADSHNVSSVTDSSNGHYEINWSNNMANTNYAVACTSGHKETQSQTDSYTATSFRHQGILTNKVEIQCIRLHFSVQQMADPYIVCAVAFGD